MRVKSLSIETRGLGRMTGSDLSDEKYDIHHVTPNTLNQMEEVSGRFTVLK